MRQIGTLAEQESAKRLCDYLISRGVAARVLSEKSGFGVWVEREDDLSRAREEFGRFSRDPDAVEYREAATVAARERARLARIEKEHQRKSVDLRTRWTGPGWSRCPATFVMIGISIVVALYSNLGSDLGKIEGLLFTRYFVEPVFDSPAEDTATVGASIRLRSTGLDAIRQGQIWRLITPAFIHFDILHIAFNVFWVYRLGCSIELARGRLRMAVLFLVFAALSNLAEYGWEAYRVGSDRITVFGGLSGVVYGLFGYIWMKSDYQPEWGLSITTNTIAWMLIWLVLCMTGLVGPIASAAHVGGLVAGVLLGVAPHLVRRHR